MRSRIFLLRIHQRSFMTMSESNRSPLTRQAAREQAEAAALEEIEQEAKARREKSRTLREKRLARDSK